MHDAFIMFCTCRQDERTTIESYLETFNNTVAIVNYAGGKLGTAPELRNMLARERGLNIDTMSTADARALRLEAQDQYLAVSFIMGADKRRFGTLLVEMGNEFLKYGESNAYPQTVTQAYSWLLRYQKD
jgi:hypothetical protein